VPTIMNQNNFSTNFLDCVSEKRKNDTWLKSQLENESSSFIPIWDSKVLCNQNQKAEPIFLSRKEFQKLHIGSQSLILLGLIEDTTYFSVKIKDKENASFLSKNNKGEFLNLKNINPLLKLQHSTLLSLARFMVDWNSKHRFCGKCGSPTKSAEAGNLRICKNEACKLNHFPSMDPAIIVLVSSAEKCLLGSQDFWPRGMYSTIAGFVEPGENIEDAVIREVKEETGISVTDIRYQSSQPWLFPSSLMLGFTAKAKNNNIIINQDELNDVRWFSREEIKAKVSNGTVKLPSKVSIAYNLIESWFNKGNFGKLSEL
jgi:NAD+ diphosphatase